MLATDETLPAHTLLESWNDNEKMRHVPTLAWIVEKLDVDLRARIDALLAPLHDLPGDDPRRAPIDHELRSLCRSLDRLADLGRHTRTNGHAPNEIVARVTFALEHAVSNIRSVDANLFGRRFPVQTHERSKAEPLYAALLVVIEHVKALIPLVRVVDARVEEKLYGGLVGDGA